MKGEQPGEQTKGKRRGQEQECAPALPQHEPRQVAADDLGKGSDGEPLPEGMYSFSVEAKKGGNTASAKPLGFARIDALTWENGSPKLILSTGQKISPSDIRELL